MVADKSHRVIVALSCFCSFLVGLSSCRVTHENCIKSSVFFSLVSGEWMDLRNSNGTELRNFYFTTAWKLFSQKILLEFEKCSMSMELNSGTYKSSK